MRDIKFRGFTINEEKYGNGKDIFNEHYRH